CFQLSYIVTSQFCDQFQSFFRRHGRMDFIIDSQGGSQSAGAQTGYSFYGEQHVICGVLLSAQSQFFLQSLQDRNRFTYMTGSPVTDLDDIFSYPGGSAERTG